MILPILLLVVLMALDLGRVFFGWVGLQNAVRQGANYAALNPEAWGSPGNATKRATYLNQLKHDTDTLNCDPESPLPDPSFPDGSDLGGRAEVRMTCDFTPLTPLVGQLFAGGTLTIGANSIFPIRGGQIAGLPVGNELPEPGEEEGEEDGCTVPSFSGTRKNDAQSTWTAAQFLTQVQFQPGSGNYVIGSQSIQGGLTDVPCDSQITVGP